MDESMRVLETELFEIMGRLKHERYVPTIEIEGLTPAESTVLMCIDRIMLHEGSAPRPGRVGRFIHMSPSALSQILKSLEDKDLVERKRDGEDSRAVSLHLTQEGEAKAEQGRARLRADVDGLESYLGEDDLRNLVSILKKVDAYFQKQVAAGHMTQHDAAGCMPPFPPFPGEGPGAPGTDDDRGGAACM